MLNKDQAIIQLKKLLPLGTPIKAFTEYRDLYLFRVEHLSEEEKNWDPFFSVDRHTGEARDFSVITDGDINEIGNLKWHDVY